MTRLVSDEVRRLHDTARDIEAQPGCEGLADYVRAFADDLHERGKKTACELMRQGAAND